MNATLRLSNRPGDPDSIRVSIVSALSGSGLPLSKAKECMEAWIETGILQVTAESPDVAGKVVSSGLTLGFKQIEVEAEA